MNDPLGKASHGRFRYRRYGMYDVTYEVPDSPFTLQIYTFLDWFRAIQEKLPLVRRLLTDTTRLAPAAFVVYMATTIWRGVYCAISLYWQSIVFDKLSTCLMNRTLSPEVYWSLVISWFCYIMLNIQVGRIHARSVEILTKQFRAYFIPRLIRASLRVDLLSIKDLYSFPIRGRLASEFPGGYFLTESSHLIQCILDLTFQFFVLLHVISCKLSPEREILSCLFIARALVWWLAPSNGIGSSAYVYWSNNRHFLKMKTLFGLAFSMEYRADLVLDGIVSSIETEYDKSAERLGSVDILEPTPWCTDLLRDWYWDFLTDITLDCPFAICALMFSGHVSPSSISSMMFLQQAFTSMSFSIGRYSKETPSLMDICMHAERLYSAIDHQGNILSGSEPFPHPIDDDAGIKISFRRVSLLYPGANHDALHDVSFDVLPGQLVLIVGTNGSGKSSLLKLLARLFDPTAGEILINDMPLVQYDLQQLRAAMVFQSQSPLVYPFTVRENIDLEHTSDDVREAARLGGCAEWIAKLNDGYDTRLEPSFDIYQQWEDLDGMYGCPSKALQQELVRHRGRPTSISGGEKQRLATARTFTRIDDRTKLVVIDEATSALDPLSEKTLLNHLYARRAKKTVVLVTHRFHHLAHLADQILCLKNGSVVESGTHAQLVGGDGEYAALYHAQIRRSV